MHILSFYSNYRSCMVVVLQKEFAIETTKEHAKITKL